MDEQDVLGRAEALGAALVSGDIELAAAEFSDELKRNLGEVLALLPLPASAATIASIERGGSSAFVVVFEVVGEVETVQVQTRWKERDGRPTVIEASHLSRQETELAAEPEEAAGEATEHAEGTGA